MVNGSKILFSIKQRNEPRNDDESKYEFPFPKNQIESIIEDNLNESRIKIKALSNIERSIINGEQLDIEEFLVVVTGDFKPVYIANVSADALHKYKFIIDARDGDIIRKTD